LPVARILLSPKARLLPTRSGISSVFGSSTLMKPGSSPLGETSMVPSAAVVPTRAKGQRFRNQGEGAALQEVDRLLVERAQDLGAGRSTRFGDDASQVGGRGQAGHGAPLGLLANRSQPPSTIRWCDSTAPVFAGARPTE